jgi:hypothetical protein
VMALDRCPQVGAICASEAASGRRRVSSYLITLAE